MKMHLFVPAVAAALVVVLTGCSSNVNPVAVQRADQLSASGVVKERFPGEVVSEASVQVQKDNTKVLEECYVTVGQTVKMGDKLFSYDLDSVKIALEKQQLEVDKMKNEQNSYGDQKRDLENKLKAAGSSSEKVRLTLEINTLKTQLMETEYQLKAKAKEIAGLQEMLENVDITSPVDGVIQKVDEEGESGAYITIQQSGAFKVRGTLNEMSMKSGLTVGSRVKIISRLDSGNTWEGQVISVGNQSQPQDNSMDANAQLNSTDYPFFVELQSTEGLLLGQHVYLELVAEDEMEGLWIPENYLMDMEVNPGDGTASAKVLVAGGNGKLQSVTVGLGQYHETSGCYEVLSGLKADAYVADPQAPGTKAGAETIRFDASDYVAKETEGMTAVPDSVTETVEMLPEESQESIPATVPEE